MLESNSFNMVSDSNDNSNIIADCCTFRSLSELVRSTCMVVIFIYYTNYISTYGLIDFIRPYISMGKVIEFHSNLEARKINHCLL